jgi:hypothetical protein
VPDEVAVLAGLLEVLDKDALHEKVCGKNDTNIATLANLNAGLHGRSPKAFPPREYLKHEKIYERCPGASATT